MNTGTELYSPQALMGLGRRMVAGLDLQTTVRPTSRPMGRVEVITGLESKVSLLQVARGGLSQLEQRLEELVVFLETATETPMAPSVANRYVTERLCQLEGVIRSVSFASKILLNGSCGVSGQAEGAGLQFVRGSARTLGSPEVGYPVSIEQLARPAGLIGSQPALPSVIAKERWIGLKEGGREARYKVQGDEAPTTLVSNLQQAIGQAGLDIQVFLTGDQRLLFLHNQLGASPSFEGVSQSTRLVSGIAGMSMGSMKGQDLKGSLGSEVAHGKGPFLVGNRSNPRTDGLIIYYDGPLDYRGQVVGVVKVQQKGLLVPLDVGAQEVEMLSLPDLKLETQAVGVPNRSGFKSLSQIRAGSAQERTDAGKLVRRSRADLEELKQELTWKEDIYVERAMGLLKNDLVSQAQEEQNQQLTAQRAQQMALDLKRMFA